MLTLLTMTGGRPDAWELCKRWMRGQTYAGPVRWIVVDDGPVPQDMKGVRSDWELTLLRPQPYWQLHQNTQRRNILAGLDAFDGDMLAVIEDDDYYSPGYLDAMVKLLEKGELVGESNALYFNLRTMAGQRCQNGQHASLCQTAMRGAAVAEFRRAALTDTAFIDCRLWRQFKGQKALMPTTLCVGIKGLPGRGGIGAGHRMVRGKVRVGDVAEIIGDDWQHYLPFMPKQ